MSGSSVIPKRAEAAWSALGAALELAGPVPCTGRSQWISEDRDDRTAAALRCARCPVIAECRDYADKSRETFGVWAGRDRTPNKGSSASLPLFDESRVTV